MRLTNGIGVKAREGTTFLALGNTERKSSAAPASCRNWHYRHQRINVYQHVSVMATPLFFTSEVTRQAPSLPPHRPRLCNRQPQADHPRPYAWPCRSYPLPLPAHNNRPTKPHLFFPSRRACMFDAPRPATHRPAHGRWTSSQSSSVPSRTLELVERAYKADELTITCQLPSPDPSVILGTPHSWQHIMTG